VNACLNQSKLEVEKLLLAKHSESAKILIQEKVRLVTPNETELKFIVNEDTLRKLAELKNLIGDQSLAKIFEMSLDAKLLAERKKRGQTSKVSDAEISLTTETSFPSKSGQTSKLSPVKTQPDEKLSNPKQKGVGGKGAIFNRYIPMHLKRLRDC
jgi:hypothetical protein